MRLSRLTAPLALLVAFGASAQFATLDPDWKEVQVAPPPTFRTDNLLPIDMPVYVTLKFGVDPATFSITADGVVRYVMVATNNSGSVNAAFEGIRCQTGEVKVYSRYGVSGQWTAVDDPQWVGLNDNLRSKHALALARQGVCDGRAAAASSVDDIVRQLKAGQGTRR